MDESLLLEEGHEICTICIDLIKKESIYFKCTNCKHYVHIDCLFKWFKKKKRIICPICKNKVRNLNGYIVNIMPDYYTKNKILVDNFINTLRSLKKINNDFDLDLDLDDENIEEINNVNPFYNYLLQCQQFVYNEINWCCSPVPSGPILLDCIDLCRVLIYTSSFFILIVLLVYLYCILFNNSGSCYYYHYNKTYDYNKTSK